MRLPLLLNLSLTLFALQNASAQLMRADDYFNSGAQFYISNSIPHALEKVESGLKVYPDNEKLKKLYELLKQQQQSQQNQQQQQKQDNQQSQKNQKQDQQQKQDQKDQQSQSDQQKQDKQDQQQGQQGKQDEQKPGQKEGEPQQVQAGQMTPQEAQKLLDAQKGDEKVLQFKPDGKPQDVNRPIKDW